ncbi:MAG: hypothetical protein HC884_14950 [Chloroflexaceae bacterium]|nr:hypothetical protein [Chloroflexaceae bacterium]
MAKTRVVQAVACGRDEINPSFADVRFGAEHQRLTRIGTSSGGGAARINGISIWRGDHVAIRQLVEDFGRYHYLPRLHQPAVLLDAIRDGLSSLTWESDTFAYAESYDEAAGRYRGLRVAEHLTIIEDDTALLVRPDVARRQLDAEVPASRLAPGSPAACGGDEDGSGHPAPGDPMPSPGDSRTVTPRPRHFHGSVRLDPEW